MITHSGHNIMQSNTRVRNRILIDKVAKVILDLLPIEMIRFRLYGIIILDIIFIWQLLRLVELFDTDWISIVFFVYAFQGVGAEILLGQFVQGLN